MEDRYEKSVALLDRKKKKEAMAWDLKFQNYWSNVVSADQNYKDGRTYSERFVHHVGVFRERAEALAKRIVEEMHLPHSHRSMRPFVNVPVEFSVFEDDDRATEIYSMDRIVFKITPVCIRPNPAAHRPSSQRRDRRA